MKHRPRLLVVVNVLAPDLGGGVLFSDLCRGLSRRGFDVTARCAYPYYPEWKDKTGQNGFRIRSTVENGVRIERFGIFIPRNPGALPARLLYEASFFASLLRRIPKRRHFDGMMVFCPLIGAVSYAAVCKRLTGLPLWLNVQDLPAEASLAGGISTAAVARRIVNFENALFNQADVWSTISPVMVDVLVRKRRRNQPVLYVPNWLHRSLARAIARQPDKTGRLPERPVRLLYSGNVGTKQNLLKLCRVLHRSPVDFRFRIQGAGSEMRSLHEAIHSTGDVRFEIRSPSDEDELARALHAADFFVITEKASSGGSFIPSKLIPALASGTPVLAVCDADSPLGQEMVEHEPGPRFEWRESGSIAELLRAVDPWHYADWQRRAVKRAAFYDRERILDLYERELRRMCLNA